MKLNKGWPFAFLFPLLFACESGVDFDRIPTSNLFSVSSFISPQDTLFKVYLFKAREAGTINNSDSALVIDAIITISDGSKADTLLFNKASKRYEAKKKNLQIIQLKSYYLRILTKTGEVLESSCTIPSTPSVVEIDGTRENNDFIFNTNWINPSTHKYFILSTFAEGFYEIDSPTGIRNVQLLSAISDDVTFPSDKQQDTNIFSGTVPNTYLAIDPKLSVFLSNIDVNLFKYFNTYQAYESWDINNDGNLFPNFREPQIVFSNITGGVGVFGGYNQTFAKIDL